MAHAETQSQASELCAAGDDEILTIGQLEAHLLADVHAIAEVLTEVAARLYRLEQEFAPLARRFARAADTPAARFVRRRQ